MTENQTAGEMTTLLPTVLPKDSNKEPGYWSYFLTNGYDVCTPGGRVFILMMLPVNFLVGVTGNILAIIVLIRTAKLRHCGYSSILLVLAVSDTFALVTRIPIWLNFIAEDQGVGPIVVLDNTAKCVFVELFTIGSFTGVWLVTLISVERFLVVCFPNQAQRICTPKRMMQAALVLTLIMTIITILFVYQVHYEPEAGACRMQLSACNWYFFGAGVIIGPFPLAFICIFNCYILFRLKSDSYLAPTSRQMRKLRRSRTSRATMMLMAVTFACALLTLPHCSILIIHACKHFNLFVNVNTNKITFVVRTIYDINYVVNFFLYCLASADFRLAFLNMVWKPLLKLRPEKSVDTYETPDNIGSSV
ncbi:uncharacterized protein LOC141904505 [Tubulanus polymorphus]|uniref:uncharacterized protein LOC141904505 n=1 Tax=Tubulanus polymorphus TaxID=672921 RepID=UPI003DA4A299